MAVKLHITTALDHFSKEGNIIGRLVVEYGELEWTLCLLASHVIEDFDVALKALYRARGESQRIDLADALIRNRIDPKVKQVYETTNARMRDCLKIRNLYAHSNWLHYGEGRLCYVDIEELAKNNQVAKAKDCPLYELNMDILKDQARFFNDVAQNLNYLCMEVQYLKGSITQAGFHYVENIQKPKMAIEVEDQLRSPA